MEISIYLAMKKQVITLPIKEIRILSHFVREIALFGENTLNLRFNEVLKTD